MIRQRHIVTDNGLLAHNPLINLSWNRHGGIIAQDSNGGRRGEQMCALPRNWYFIGLIPIP